MTGATITIDDEDVLGALSRLIASARGMTPALKNIGEELAKSAEARIRAGVTPAGQKFAPLNPLYAATKKGAGILRESGELVGDIGNGIVYQLAGDDSVAVGTSRLHARVHQFGATIVPKNAAALVFSLGGKTIHAASVTIPARPFLGVSDSDRAAILDIVEDHLAMAVDGAAAP